MRLELIMTFIEPKPERYRGALVFTEEYIKTALNIPHDVVIRLVKHDVDRCMVIFNVEDPTGTYITECTPEGYEQYSYRPKIVFER